MIIFPAAGTHIDAPQDKITAYLQIQDTLVLPCLYDNGASINLTGQPITAVGVDNASGGLRQFGGEIIGGNGELSWQLSSGDVGRVASYTLRFVVEGDIALESYPLTYTVTLAHDPATERVERQMVDGEPVYEVVQLTETERIARLNALADATDNEIPARATKELLRGLVDLDGDDPDKWAELFPAWKAGIALVVGDMVQYDGMVWRVIQGHTTQLDWPPPIVPALFERVLQEGDTEWAAGVAYAVNDEVAYQGVSYRCLQAHTSQVGWEPPNVPALWAVV